MYTGFELRTFSLPALSYTTVPPPHVSNVKIVEINPTKTSTSYIFLSKIFQVEFLFLRVTGTYLSTELIAKPAFNLEMPPSSESLVKLNQ